MIPYLAYQRKRFFDFCLEKFCLFHTFRKYRGFCPQKEGRKRKNAQQGQAQLCMPDGGGHILKSGGEGMDSRIPQTGRPPLLPFAQAAVLFGVLCLFARGAVLAAACLLCAPLPAAQTALWQSRREEAAQN